MSPLTTKTEVLDFKSPDQEEVAISMCQSELITGYCLTKVPCSVFGVPRTHLQA